MTTCEKFKIMIKFTIEYSRHPMFLSAPVKVLETLPIPMYQGKSNFHLFYLIINFDSISAFI